MKWTTSSPNWNQIPKLMNMSILASLGIHLREPVFLQMIQLLLHFPAVTIGKSICVLVLFTFGIHCTCVRITFLDKLFFNESLHVSHIVPVEVGKIPLERRGFATFALTDRLLLPFSCFLHTTTLVPVPLFTRTQIPLEVGENQAKCKKDIS